MGTKVKNKRQQLSNRGSMMSSDNQGALFLLELYLPKPEPVSCVSLETLVSHTTGSDSSEGLGHLTCKSESRHT